MDIDWKRTIYILVAAAIGVLAGLFGQPYIHGNDRAIGVIVNVFSILAGFLVAVMTIMGDPTGLVSRSWRYIEKSRPSIYNKLLRQKYLFILYLLVLLLISVQSLIERQYPGPAAVLEQIYFGGAVFAFILSMGLPTALMKIQMAKHDELVEARRHNFGVKK